MMEKKKYLVIFPAQNGFFVRRGDNAAEALDGDQLYVAHTPEEVSSIVLEHCKVLSDDAQMPGGLGGIVIDKEHWTEVK